MENYKVEDLEVRIYKNGESKLKHSRSSVYHGISLSNLQRHKNGILIPENITLPDDVLENKVAKNYSLFFGKQRHIHLGPLEIAGYLNHSYDIHFCFDINQLKETNEKLVFINHDVWTRIGFYVDFVNREKIETAKRKLFLPDYAASRTTEVLADRLDIRQCNYALVYDNAVREGLEHYAKKYGLALNIKNFKRKIPSWLIPKRSR